MKSIDSRNTKNAVEGFNPQADNKARSPEPSTFITVLFYISFILIFPIFWYFGIKNRFIKMQTEVNQQASGIDIQLAKRRDIIIKSFETVKGYIKHEKEILTEITKLRSQPIDASNRSEMDSKMENISTQFKLAFEAYPDLKANNLMVQFMDEISDVEREIAAARRLYNSDVQEYNAFILRTPEDIVAAHSKLVTLPLFAASATQRQDVEVKF